VIFLFIEFVFFKPSSAKISYKIERASKGQSGMRSYRSRREGGNESLNKKLSKKEKTIFYTPGTPTPLDISVEIAAPARKVATMLSRI